MNRMLWVMTAVTACILTGSVADGGNAQEPSNAPVTVTITTPKGTIQRRHAQGRGNEQKYFSQWTRTGSGDDGA